MSICNRPRHLLTQRFWLASLAWRGKGDYAKGWTVGSLIDELSDLRIIVGVVGIQADAMLQDVIEDKPLRPLQRGELLPFMRQYGIDALIGQQVILNVKMTK